MKANGTEFSATLFPLLAGLLGLAAPLEKTKLYKPILQSLARIGVNGYKPDKSGIPEATGLTSADTLFVGRVCLVDVSLEISGTTTELEGT